MVTKKSVSAKVLDLNKSKTSKKSKPASKVEFRYIFADSYNPVYCNGAYGGIGSQKDLTINFYQERAPIPHSQTYLLSPDGKSLGAEVDRVPKLNQPLLVRVITTGITLDEEAARRLYTWLGAKIATYDEMKKAK